MADMNIRNVPDELLAEIKRKALDAGETLRDYVLAKLAEPGRGYVVERKAKPGDVTVETLQRGYAENSEASKGFSRRARQRRQEAKAQQVAAVTGKPCSHGLLYHPDCTD